MCLNAEHETPDSRMNIGFLYGLQVHQPGTGGSVHGYQLAKNLADAGHKLLTWFWTDPECSLLTHYRGRELLSFLRTIDVLYIRIEWENNSARSSLLRYLGGKRIPVVWEINGLPEEKTFHGSSEQDIARIKRRLKRYASHVDVAICVSDGIATYAREQLGIKRTAVIPNGSDPELFKPITKEPGDCSRPLRVTWVGTTKAGWHDLETMLSAARILADSESNIEFWIFGDPTNLPEDLPANIIARGVVPYEELATELPSADIGLHLYKADISTSLDSSPLKQFDYMASGLCLVAQPHGQRQTLLEDWHAGIAVDANPQSLADALLVLEKDRETVKKLGMNGRKAVREFYNWQRVSTDTTRLLDDLKK